MRGLLRERFGPAGFAILLAGVYCGLVKDDWTAAIGLFATGGWMLLFVREHATTRRLREENRALRGTQSRAGDGR